MLGLIFALIIPHFFKSDYSPIRVKKKSQPEGWLCEGTISGRAHG
jgi:hypothetical protein